MSEIDKIKRAMMLAYVGDVGRELSNDDCNDLAKYISGLELEVKSLTARAEEAETKIGILETALDTKQAVYDKLIRDYLSLKIKLGEWKTLAEDASIRAEAAEAQAKELAETLSDVISEISNSRDGHIGADRVYCPQINTETVDRWRSLIAKIGGAG